MGKSSRNKMKQLENYKLTYSDMGPSMSTGKPLTQDNKYKKILDEICLDKMKLYGMNKKEEEAIIKIKGEALIEKEDPGSFVILIRLEGKINLNALADTGSDINVMPYRVYKELGREEVQNVKKGITMLNHSKAEPMGLLSDVLCQVGILNTIDKITSTFDGICHQTFCAAKTSLDTVERDSEDEEEYAIQKNKFGALIYEPKPARYLNCNDPLDRSLALQEVLNPFRKISVWKKVLSFLRSLLVALQHVEWKPDYTGCFNRKEDSDEQWHAEIRLTDPYGNTMGTHDDEAGSSRPKRSRQYETVKEVLLPQVYHEFLEWEGLQVKAGNYEEIFTSVAWVRAFNINEPVYSKLCHEFYSTYEFDEVCVNDELKTKKKIKFHRHGGPEAHDRFLTLCWNSSRRHTGLTHELEI
ncbi:gag protease polyprotein [Tanacetum coccineum]